MSFSCTKHIQASKVKHTDGIPSLKVSSLVSWKLFHFCCTLCMYSISDNKADFEFGNVHFRSFGSSKCGEAWVDCVYSDSDSERQQLWSTFRKGEVIFFSLSLCAEQRFTASPWLLQLGYITANMWKMRRRGKKRRKMDEGKNGWCHPFYSNKEDPVSRENTKTLHFFL